MRFTLSCHFRITLQYSHYLQIDPSHGNIALMSPSHSTGAQKCDFFSSAQTLLSSSNASNHLDHCSLSAISPSHQLSLRFLATRTSATFILVLTHGSGREVCRLGNFFFRSLLANPKSAEPDANPLICLISTSETAFKCIIAAFQRRRPTQDDGISRP